MVRSVSLATTAPATPSGDSPRKLASRKIPRSTTRGHVERAAKQWRRNDLDRASGEKTRQPVYFTQQDPIGIAGGANVYGFASGDPVTYSDPFGLCPNPSDAQCQWFEAGMTGAGMMVGLLFGGGAGIAMTVGSGGALAPAAVATAVTSSATGAAVGAAVGRILSDKLFSKSEDAAGSGGDSGPQDHRLTNGEIKKLQNGGVDVHELKGGKNASKFDLYKNRDGEVFVKPKGGKGPGDATGLNIRDY